MKRIFTTFAALLLCGAALAQSPGTMILPSNTQMTAPTLAAAVNAALAAKADATNPVITGALSVGGTSVIAGALSVGGTSITGFGTAIGQALGPLVSSGGANLPMLSTGNRLIFRRQNPADGDNTDFQFDRTTTYTGGTTANINRVIGVIDTIGANDGAQNAGILSIANTSSTVAGYALPLWVQARRLAGSNAWLWGAVISSDDQTGLSSATSGASNLAGIELDMGANKADDATNPATFGGIGNRKGIHIALSRSVQADATATEYSTGLWFSTNSTFGGGAVDTAITLAQGVGFQPGMSVRSALDTRGAIPPTGSSNPVSAVTMTAGHVVDFNGGPALDSAPGNYFQYSAAGGRLEYHVGATPVFAFHNTGTAAVGGITVTTGVQFDILGTAGVALRTTQSSATTALRMSPGQLLSFSLTDNRTIRYDTLSGKLFYAVAGADVFSIDVSGNVKAAGTITASTTP